MPVPGVTTAVDWTGLLKNVGNFMGGLGIPPVTMAPQGGTPFGQVPMPGPPPTHIAPGTIDLQALGTMLNQGAGVPPMEDLPAPPPQDHRKTTDYTPFFDQMAKVVPVDPRESEGDYKKGRTVHSLAAAAEAAGRPNQTSGQIIANAAGAFLNSRASADDERRREDLEYQEAMRQHELQSIQLHFQAQQAQDAMATANSDIDYKNAAANYNTSIANIGRHDERGKMLVEAGQRKAANALQLAQLGQAQQSEMNTNTNANLDRQYAYENAKLQATAPKMLGVSNGIATMMTVDKDGNQRISEVPINEVARIDQENQALSALGPEIAGLKKPEMDYARLKAKSPELVKIKLVMDLLKKGYGGLVFDPKNPNNYSLLENIGREASTFGNPGGAMTTDLEGMLTTSKYEHAINQMNDLRGRNPNMSEDDYTQGLAALLAQMLDDKVFDRAKEIKDPTIMAGVKALGR